MGRKPAEWAKILGVSAQYVGQLRKGKTSPAAAMRDKIHAAGGPEPKLWDVLIHQPTTVRDVIADSDSHEPDSDNITATPEGVQALADRLMRDALRMQREVMTGEMDNIGRVNALAKLASIVTEMGKLTGAAQVNERQIRLSPAFRQLVDRMVDALRPWPDALRAIHAELSP